MKKMNAAVLGVGTMGGTHVEAALESPFIDKVYGFEPDPERAKERCGKYGIIPADLNTILADRSIGFVSIASPNETTFKEQIRTIIRQAQAQHGSDTKFIWVFDMYTTRNTPNQYVKDVFAEFGGEAAGFYTLNFYVNKEGGNSGHPIHTAHDGYTKILVDFIKAKNILP